jgi:hypothetical protein
MRLTGCPKLPPIFYFDAMMIKTLSPFFKLENTTVYVKRKKSKLNKFINDTKNPLEGYGFLREDGIEIQLIPAEESNYILIADPSDETNIQSIKLNLEEYIASL